MQSAEKSVERRDHQDSRTTMFGSRVEEQESVQETKKRSVRVENILENL